MSEHNHFTRDIKAPGKCPACDAYHAKHPDPLLKQVADAPAPIPPIPEEPRRSRVDKVTCTYFRKGKCEACGKSGVERTQNFSGTTMEMCEEQAAVWMRTPLVHKKCEGRI